MIIYRDIVSNDELFSDTFPMKLLDGAVWEVTGKQIQYSLGVDESAIGANASAEEAAEGSEDTIVSGIDVCLANKLVETAFNKKDYQTYIKGYMKSIKERLEKEEPGESDVFMKGAAKFIKRVLGEYKEYQFWQGEGMNADGMVALMKWDEETPILYFFKHGLLAEKV